MAAMEVRTILKCKRLGISLKRQLNIMDYINRPYLKYILFQGTSRKLMDSIAAIVCIVYILLMSKIKYFQIPVHVSQCLKVAEYL